MLDGAWFKAGALDYIFGLGELTTFCITTEIVEWVAFGGRSISAGRVYPGNTLLVVLSLVDRIDTRSVLKLRGQETNGLLIWNGMKWNPYT